VRGGLRSGRGGEELRLGRRFFTHERVKEECFAGGGAGEGGQELREG
jgi:hypothetical protein